MALTYKIICSIITKTDQKLQWSLSKRVWSCTTWLFIALWIGVFSNQLNNFFAGVLSFERNEKELKAGKYCVTSFVRVITMKAHQSSIRKAKIIHKLEFLIRRKFYSAKNLIWCLRKRKKGSKILKVNNRVNDKIGERKQRKILKIPINGM